MIRCLLLASTFALTAAPEGVPKELQPFTIPNHEVLEVATADLNRDGRPDYLIALQPAGAEEEGELDERPRPLLIVVRSADGTLELAARNDRAIFCRDCGGMMGDPFQGLDASPGRFTIRHYGGSAWRWSDETTFAWSRRDRSWQLVEVKTESFHASDPDNGESETLTPPKDFGKIDFREFDPDNYRGVGPK